MRSVAGRGDERDIRREQLLQAALDMLPRTIPLIERGKRPVHEDWPHWTATRETVQAWWRERPDSNVGIRCGNGLVVVDVDPRHGGREALQALQQRHGPLPATLTSLTGGGGIHAYYRGPKDLRSFEPAPGLEIKANGHQVVAPPSVHPDTGRPYRWPGDGAFLPRLIAPLPSSIVDLERERRVARSAAALRDMSPGPGRDGDPLRTIPASEYVPILTGREINREGYVQCPFHRGGEERTPSLRAFEDPARGWRCFATGCGAAGDVYTLVARLRGVDRLTGREFVKVRYELGEQLVDRGRDLDRKVLAQDLERKVLNRDLDDGLGRQRQHRRSGLGLGR
ncbi:MAG: bifunctional DNA primase/polymerase [Solirubrobacteraceae bacterium]